MFLMICFFGTFSMYFYRSEFVTVMFICFIFSYAATCFFNFHIRGCSLQEPQLIVVVARFRPHSSALMAPICGFHSHSSALTQQGQTSRNRSALMPHSRVSITFMQVALIRTHGGIMTFSPHSSALIRTHPHDPCTYASTHLPRSRVSGCL